MGAKIEVISHYMTVTHEYPDFIVTLQTYLCRFLSDFQVLEHERADFYAGTSWMKITGRPPTRRSCVN
ncbi:MAG: hypothetical protein ACLRTQ_02165 [Candidatus Borkfalkia sp.]